MREDYRLKLSYLDNPIIGLEIINSICGQFIGSGCFREVYEYSLDSNYIVKIENHCENWDEGGCNFAEWNLWTSAKDDLKKWLAPCNWISDNGLVLVQRKTYPLDIKSDKKIPDKIPAIFKDVKRDNWGWIGNNMVCHDYAFLTTPTANKMQTTLNKLVWKDTKKS